MLIITLLTLILTTVSNAQESPTFACDLYKALAADTDNKNKNICFSPFSVQTGIEMAYEGAQGTTAQEIKMALHLKQHDTQRHTEKKQILDLLNEKQDAYTLTCSNNLWIQKGFPVKKRYTLEILQNFYNTQDKVIDFAGNPRAAEQKINKVVNEQTLGHIPEILSSGSLSDLTRLVLTNALYFKGSWEKPFDSNNTSDESFTVDAKTKVTVPLMHIPNGKYLYAENNNLQMLELPYKGDALSMIIILPKEKNLSALEKQLSPHNLAQWQEELSFNTINLYLPRFTFGTAYILNDTLMNLGIHAAFTAPTKNAGADFSGIDGKRDLYISLVAHQATLEVNEEGTVATAATAVVMNMKSMRPQQAIEFRADHPFIFFIKEKTTGTLLFMGRVVNPNA